MRIALLQLRCSDAGLPDKAFHVDVLGDIFYLFPAREKECAWEHGLGPCATLRAFGKGVSEKVFHAEVPWGVLFLFRRQKGTRLGTQGTYHLKLLFCNSFSECPKRKKFSSFPSAEGVPEALLFWRLFHGYSFSVQAKETKDRGASTEREGSYPELSFINREDAFILIALLGCAASFLLFLFVLIWSRVSKEQSTLSKLGAL